MKGIAEIQNKLANSLENRESGSWSRLRNSLIGKELLAFGAEVISASDNIADTFVQAFDYQQADERALISLSHVHNLAVSFTKPAYIRVRLLNKVGMTFKPFDLVYTVGNVKFTNISFFTGNDDIILYQGMVKTMFTERLVDYNYEKEVTWDRTVIPIGGDEIITGHNIGRALPDSVYAFYKDNVSRGIMSEFGPLSSGPELPVYKLFTLMNKDILVLDGDGKWGKMNYVEPKFQILWLDPTSNSFTLNGTLTSNIYGKLSYQVMGSDHAVEESLDYARDVFRRFYLKLNAIVSREQIQQFVKTFSYVNDCYVTANNANVVIYVKPSDPNDIGEYGAIEAELDLKGSILTKHEVFKGKSLNFQFKLSEDLDSELRSQIEEYLISKCGYDTLGYTEVVDCSRIAAELYAIFGVNSRVTFIVNKTSVESGTKFRFVPIEGTIKLIDATGRETGYDLNGQLFSEVKQESYEVVAYPNDINCSQFGRFINSGEQFVWFDNGYIHKYPTTVLLNLLDVTADDIRFITHNGYSYAYTNKGSSSKLVVFDIEHVTPQGLNSNIIPISGTEPKSIQKITSTSIPIYSNGGIYCLEKLDTELQLRFFSGVGYSAYFTLNIPIQSGTKVLGTFLTGNRLYVVCNNNAVIVISDFNTALVGWEMLKLEIVDNIVSGEIIAFQCYKNGVCAALIKSESTINLVRFTELSQSDSSVKLMNMVVVGNFSNSFVGTYTLQVTEDNIKVIYYGPVLVVKPRVFDVEIEPVKSIVIYDNDGVKYEQTEDQGYPVYIYDKKKAVVGSVNYLDGTVVYDASVSGTSFTYQSTKVILDEKTYLTLNEEVPVLWN